MFESDSMMSLLVCIKVNGADSSRRWRGFWCLFYEDSLIAPHSTNPDPLVLNGMHYDVLGLWMCQEYSCTVTFIVIGDNKVEYWLVRLTVTKILKGCLLVNSVKWTNQYSSSLPPKVMIVIHFDKRWLESELEIEWRESVYCLCELKWNFISSFTKHKQVIHVHKYF